MNLAYQYRQRVNFLALKSQTLGLSADEQAELERLQRIRVRETSGAVFVEPIPMSVDEWKAMVARVRGTQTSLLADDKHKNT